MEAMQRGRMMKGVVLMALGTGLFALQYAEGFSISVIFLLIGGVFLAGYFGSRAHGYLIPGCIMLGFGLGWLADDLLVGYGDLQLVGLGFGFVAITLIGLVVERRKDWWPLMPGGVLLLIGLAQGLPDMTELVWKAWPLVLVVIGIFIVIGAARGTSGTASKLVDDTSGSGTASKLVDDTSGYGTASKLVDDTFGSMGDEMGKGTLSSDDVEDDLGGGSGGGQRL